jgi:hypothetical protein
MFKLTLILLVLFFALQFKPVFLQASSPETRIATVTPLPYISARDPSPWDDRQLITPFITALPLAFQAIKVLANGIHMHPQNLSQGDVKMINYCMAKKTPAELVSWVYRTIFNNCTRKAKAKRVSDAEQRAYSDQKIIELLAATDKLAAAASHQGEEAIDAYWAFISSSSKGRDIHKSDLTD